MRIYPPYWFYSLVFYCIGLIGLKSFDYSNIEHRTPIQFLSAVFLLPITTASTGFLAVSWSLFYEILFYLVFSTFFLGRKIGYATLSVFITVCLLNHDYWLVRSFCFNHINVLFLIGVLIGLHPAQLTRLRLPPSAMILLGGALYIGSLWISPNVSWPIVYVAAVLLVLGCVLRDGLAGRATEEGRTERAFLWLGTISYSLYLCHVPAQTVVYALTRQQPLLIVLFLIVPLCVASASYLWIEAPAQRFARTILRGSQRDRVPGNSPPFPPAGTR